MHNTERELQQMIQAFNEDDHAAAMKFSRRVNKIVKREKSRREREEHE